MIYHFDKSRAARNSNDITSAAGRGTVVAVSVGRSCICADSLIHAGIPRTGICSSHTRLENYSSQPYRGTHMHPKKYFLRCCMWTVNEGSGH